MTDQRARAEQLFTKLDGMARAFDKYEYGLPSHTDKRVPYVDLIAAALADERRRVWEEAAKMACSRCAVGMPRNEHWFHLTCDATKYWLKAHAGQVDAAVRRRRYSAERRPLMWTTERPTTAGWFWWRFTPGASVHILKVAANLSVRSLDAEADHVDECGGEWQPVQPPRD